MMWRRKNWKDGQFITGFYINNSICSRNFVKDVNEYMLTLEFKLFKIGL